MMILEVCQFFLCVRCVVVAFSTVFFLLYFLSDSLLDADNVFHCSGFVAAVMCNATDDQRCITGSPSMRASLNPSPPPPSLSKEMLAIAYRSNVSTRLVVQCLKQVFYTNCVLFLSKMYFAGCEPPKHLKAVILISINGKTIYTSHLYSYHAYVFLKYLNS